VRDSFDKLIEEYELEKAVAVVGCDKKLKFCFVDHKHVHVFCPYSLKKWLQVKHNIPNLYSAYSKCLMTQQYRYFITGSYYKPRSCNYEFSFKQMQMVPRASMLSDRCYHAFVEIKNNQLLAISGSHTSHCEVYDVEQDSWKEIAKLHHMRRDHMALVCEQTTVYVFGGLREHSNIVELCEKIVIDSNLNGVWNQVSIKTSCKEFPIYFQSCLQLNVTEFLIFGGHNKNYKSTLNCIKFNAKTGAMTSADCQIKKEDLFQGASLTLPYKDKYYAISVHGNLHIYNHNKWQVIEKFIDQVV